VNTPTTNILGFLSVFSGSASFYVNDTITFTLKNNTVVGPVPWLAIYNNPGDTGPLTTGGDFYNFFVLGQYPASYDPNSSPASEPDADTDASEPDDPVTTDPTSWGNPAYPDNPDVVQPDLSTSGGGFVTGYFLNSSSIGVLSIPSFLEYGDAVGTFSDSVGEFLRRSKAAGLKKIVIDLQHNDGGAALLAHDTFKHVRTVQTNAIRT
jgi:Peptidase family S41